MYHSYTPLGSTLTLCMCITNSDCCSDMFVLCFSQTKKLTVGQCEIYGLFVQIFQGCLREVKKNFMSSIIVCFITQISSHEYN